VQKNKTKQDPRAIGTVWLSGGAIGQCGCSRRMRGVPYPCLFTVVYTFVLVDNDRDSDSGADCDGTYRMLFNEG
jgi:hypothetical protein